MSVWRAPAVVPYQGRVWAFAADKNGVIQANRYGGWWSGWSNEFGSFRGVVVSAGLGFGGQPVVFGSQKARRDDRPPSADPGTVRSCGSFTPVRIDTGHCRVRRRGEPVRHAVRKVSETSGNSSSA